MKDTIGMSGVVAEALSSALGQDFCRVEMPERMAWIVLLMKELPDTEAVFPHGKWATIQEIERQLDCCIKECVRQLPDWGGMK